MTTNETLNFLLTNLNIPPSEAPDMKYIRTIITDLQYEGELAYKLYKDGYLREKSYIITIEGRLFIEDGGYVEKKKRDAIILREKNASAKRMERNELLLVIGTFLIVLVEILIHRKVLLSLFHCH